MRRAITPTISGFLLAALGVLLATSSQEKPCETLTGQVVSITDGDTLTVLVDKTQHKIRLYGIDAPERGQPFGTKARQLAGILAFGRIARVEVMDYDRYGRLVGVVTVPGDKRPLVLNHELVRAGLAWHYRKYAPKDKTLAKLEAEARKAKRGLWADPTPTPPWECRQRRPEATKTGKLPANAQGLY